MTRPRVLVVDDEAPFAAAVAEHLADAGYEARTARSCLHALEVAAAFRPDAVVTDLRMPCSSGLDLLEILRRSGNECAVVVLTAYGNVHDVLRARHWRADGFVRKPCSLDRLVEVVDRALARRGAAAA